MQQLTNTSEQIAMDLYFGDDLIADYDFHAQGTDNAVTRLFCMDGSIIELQTEICEEGECFTFAIYGSAGALHDGEYGDMGGGPVSECMTTTRDILHNHTVKDQ